MGFFEKLLSKYHDSDSSEFDKGVALGRMQEMCYQKDMYNKKHNPSKYNADMEKKALEKAAYYAAGGKALKDRKS